VGILRVVFTDGKYVGMKWLWSRNLYEVKSLKRARFCGNSGGKRLLFENSVGKRWQHGDSGR
jgi:hypothetical protein